MGSFGRDAKSWGELPKESMMEGDACDEYEGRLRLVLGLRLQMCNT